MPAIPFALKHDGLFLFRGFDDGVAVRVDANREDDRTATDGAVLDESLPRSGRRVDTHVVDLPAIWARIAGIAFERHTAPFAPRQAFTPPEVSLDVNAVKSL